MTGLLDFANRRSRSFLIGAALVIVLIVGLAGWLLWRLACLRFSRELERRG